VKVEENPDFQSNSSPITTQKQEGIVTQHGSPISKGHASQEQSLQPEQS
jgi:hypothetical protein